MTNAGGAYTLLPMRSRLPTVLGCAAILLLLVSSIIPDMFLLLASTAPGFPPAIRWLIGAHPILGLLSLMVVAWKWRERSVWLVALIVALLPWGTYAAVMLI